jgi:hypothetical protein
MGNRYKSAEGNESGLSSNRWLETPVETENPIREDWKPTTVSVGSAWEDVTYQGLYFFSQYEK